MKNPNGLFDVIDGHQRLATLRDFFENNFQITNAEILTELNGKKFVDFSSEVSECIKRSLISAVIIIDTKNMKQPSTENLLNLPIKRLVFNRLNSGGKIYNPQEIRSALNPGNFNNLILALSRFEKFTEVFQIPPHVHGEISKERQQNKLFTEMKDCELVLRYFALRDESNIKGSLKSILDRTMTKRMTTLEVEEESENFKSRFEFLYHLFDTKPFLMDGKVSLHLYDGLMVAINRLWNKKSEISNNKERIKLKLMTVLNSAEQRKIIVGVKGSSTETNARIRFLMNILSPDI